MNYNSYYGRGKSKKGDKGKDSTADYAAQCGQRTMFVGVYAAGQRACAGIVRNAFC